MKLFFYYALHSVKNQIKKLFHTWVAIVVAACFVFGVLVGIGAALLSDAFESESPDAPAEEESEVTEDEPRFSEEEIMTFVELGAGGIILVIFFFNIISADKSGSSIFLMADVNLLFPSPLKPQSVLLFRLASQLFLTLIASIYVVFQLPALITLGVDGWVVAGGMAAWVLTLVYGKLINVLVYTYFSSHPAKKRLLRPITNGTAILIGAGFFVRYLSCGKDLLLAADTYFNAFATRMIPIYGWLKGMIVWSAEGKPLFSGLCFFLLIVVALLLTFAIWHMKADFYEEAMAKSQETAEMVNALQENALAKRKKDRSEKYRRDGLNRGQGASVFFWKSVYNRFRFAHFHVLTKTAETYLVFSVGGALLMLFAVGTNRFEFIGYGLCAFAFFRALGNPIARDMNTPYFTMVPENPWKKVFWSMLGGSLDCFLDLLPSMTVCALLMRASVAEWFAYLLLAVTLDFYTSAIMLFMEFSLPSSIALQIKQAFSVLFVYFGLLPVIAVIAVLTLFLNASVLATLFGSFATLALGAVFYGISPLFLLRGRK